MFKKIKIQIKKGKSCFAKLDEKRSKLISHNIVLDSPEYILPWPLSILQNSAQIIHVNEFVEDKVISRKEYNFWKINCAIKEFLKETEENEIIFLGRV